MKLTYTSFLTIALLSTLLTACGGGKSNYDFDNTDHEEPAALPHGPVFDPDSRNIPMPNDLAFNYGADGTINIANDKNDDGIPDSPVIAAINELDGASTSNPMIVNFGMPLEPASLIVGESIRVFEVTRAGPAVTGVVREVTAAEIIVKVVGDNADTLALIPFPPLKESTSYEIVLTNGIKDTSGKPAQTSSVYNIVRSTSGPLTGAFAPLEPVRQHINNLELIAQSQGIDVNTIVLSWAFGTQSTTAVLNAIAANATANTLVMAPATGLNTSHVASAIDYAGLAYTGVADIRIGTLDVPYYLEAPSAQNPIAPLTGYWKGVGGSSLTRYNTTPIATQTLTIPVMMTVPNASSGKVKPAAGWPLVIYQHGITRYRTDMLIYADSLAKAGFALIAMDLPLHGVPKFLADGSPNPFHAAHTSFPADVEPSFDVDYMNNATQAPGPDGTIDSSGAHYINLQSLLTSRDNNRQGVSNLLVLRRSLGSITDIDTSKVSFIAHSLGGVVGVPYLGVEDQVTPSALITTGASIATIIRDSATFGPVVKGGFLAGDPSRTEASYAEFLQAVQWVLDSSDPVNFAMDAAITHPIFMTEVIGDGATHSFDTTLPNSSTEILAALLRVQPAAATSNPVTVGAPRIIRFTQGDHSSILDPTDDVPAGIASYINVFEEMHSQISTFMTSGGTKVDISDFGIILQ
ncbi:MAG TPA: lipase [Thiotrichaceae bacterium]|nr:lipase [Thiotrichaceae bacterium]